MPRRLLAPRDAIAIMVGLVIGAGIFKTPSMVAGMAGDAGWILLIWLLGAMISLAGALCYAELSAAYPHAGGDYHFLARAYGKNISFLYAWAKATVINTGSVALLAFVFGDFMTQVLVLGPYSSAIWAVAGLSVVCGACGYLAYSGIVYAASQNAVHVSLWVMTVGLVLLLLMNFSQRPAVVSAMD